MADRKPIPDEVQTTILTGCARRCSLCFGFEGDLESKKGQIAHIDRNPSNASEANLVFLCMDHHDEYDSRTSQCKGITEGELSEYKALLVQAIAEKQHIGWKPNASTEASKQLSLSDVNRSGAKCSQILDVYFGWCAQHRSTTTVRHYRSRLDTFKTKFGNRKLKDIESFEIEEWYYEASAFPDGRLKSPDTRRANLVAFERFQRWALERELMPEAIKINIEKPQGNLRDRIPTADEIKAICEAASPAFRRIYQALRLTGAKPGELARLNIQDWDQEKSRLVLSRRAHGNPQQQTTRVIPVGDKLRTILMEAVGDRTSGAVFLTPQNKPWVVSSLSQTFRRLRDQLGLSEELVLFAIRHEHGMRMCEAIGVHNTQQSLGHANVQSTQRYVKQDEKSLRDIQAAQDAFE